MCRKQLVYWSLWHWGQHSTAQHVWFLSRCGESGRPWGSLCCCLYWCTALSEDNGICWREYQSILNYLSLLNSSSWKSSLHMSSHVMNLKEEGAEESTLPSMPCYSPWVLDELQFLLNYPAVPPGSGGSQGASSSGPAVGNPGPEGGGATPGNRSLAPRRHPRMQGTRWKQLKSQEASSTYTLWNWPSGLRIFRGKDWWKPRASLPAPEVPITYPWIPQDPSVTSCNPSCNPVWLTTSVSYWGQKGFERAMEFELCWELVILKTLHTRIIHYGLLCCAVFCHSRKYCVILIGILCATHWSMDLP